MECNFTAVLSGHKLVCITFRPSPAQLSIWTKIQNLFIGSLSFTPSLLKVWRGAVILHTNSIRYVLSSKLDISAQQGVKKIPKFFIFYE